MSARHCLAAIVALALLPAGAGAEPMPCGARQDFVARLQERYGEVPRVLAINRAGVVVELFASPAGSWTAVVTTADGQSCLFDAGDGFSILDPLPGEKS